MKCYVLKSDEKFNVDTTLKEEVSNEVEIKIKNICSKYQARNLSQTGSSRYDDDGIYSTTIYEPLVEENFVVCDKVVIGYYADHFYVLWYVENIGVDEKIRLGDYDFSDYRNWSCLVDRGHVSIVTCPDTDINPYADEPRFHSQEEYDDYIKWRD